MAYSIDQGIVMTSGAVKISEYVYQVLLWPIVIVIYCGCDEDDKLKLTKFGIVFELIFAFIKRRFCLGLSQLSLSARSLVIRVSSEPASNSALPLNVLPFIVTSTGITCKYVLFVFWGILVIWLLLTTEFVSTGDWVLWWSKKWWRLLHVVHLCSDLQLVNWWLLDKQFQHNRNIFATFFSLVLLYLWMMNIELNNVVVHKSSNPEWFLIDYWYFDVNCYFGYLFHHLLQ